MSVRRAVRPRRARRRAGRQVQHGRDGPAPRRPLERRRQAARRRQPGDVPGPVARARRRRGADRLDHQRRARAHVGVAARRRAAVARRRRGLARRRRRALVARPRDRPDGGVGDAQRRPRRARPPGPPEARRRRARLVGADRRVRPPLRHVQAGHAAAVGARPPAGAAARRRATDPVRVRRQGPPGRHAGQGADPAHRAVRPPGRRAPPLRVPRRLRHLDRPGDVPRLRRVAEHAAPAARGVRDVRDEGGAQRRPQLQHPRRLVGRVLRPTHGGNGWAIESAEDDPDQERRDLREAASLFGILENQVVPRFYDRGRDGVPREWVSMVLQAWATLGPEVTASRMVRDYTPDLYEPAAASSITLSADGGKARRRAGGVARARRGGVGRGVDHVRRRRRERATGRRPPRRHRRRRPRRADPEDVCVQSCTARSATTASSPSTEEVELAPTGPAPTPARSPSPSPAPTASRRGCSRCTPAWPARSTSAAWPGPSDPARRRLPQASRALPISRPESLMAPSPMPVR